MRTEKSKIRALSWMLLLAMIFASLPVFVGTSADAATLQGTSEESVADLFSATGGEQKADYKKYYVTDGLVGLYTAFDPNDFDVLNGVWRNQVARYPHATLRGTYWTMRDGGVGYRMTLNEWKTDAASVGVSLPDEFADYENFYTEVFAMVVGITDRTGKRHVNSYTPAVTDETGAVVTPASGARFGYFKSNLSAFRFELISTLFFCSLDDRGDAYSLGQRWYLFNGGYPGSIPSAANSEYFEGDATHSEVAFRLAGPDDVPTPAQMRVSKSTVGQSVTYSYAYENSYSESSLTITGARREALLAYKGKDGATPFSLFNGVPATVYAIRVYNRTLKETEMLQNAFVDKAAHYGLDMEKYEALSAEEKEKLHMAFSPVSFAEDKDYVKALYTFHTESNTETILSKLLAFEGCRPVLCEGGGFRLLFSVNDALYDFVTASGYTVSYGGIVASAELVSSNDDMTAEGRNVTLVPVFGKGGSELFYETVTAGKRCFSIAVTAEDVLHYTRYVRVRGYVAATDEKGGVTYAYTDVFSEAMPDGSGSLASVADYFVNRYEGDIRRVCEYHGSAILRSMLAASNIPVRTLPEKTLSLYVDPVSGRDTNTGTTAATAYATVACAMDAAKAYLATPGKRIIDIYLAKGTHVVPEALTLSGDEIRASEYRLRIIGAGEETVLTSQKAIDSPVLGTDAETGAKYLRLPKGADGNYPTLRAIFGDGKLLTLAHRGDSENVALIKSFRVVDASGNTLDTVDKNDWDVVAEQAAQAKYGIFTLPAELFPGDLDDYRGAEIHLGVSWIAFIMHIDHIEMKDASEAEVYVNYSACPEPYSTHSLKGRSLWLENAKAFLKDNPDTYYYDRNEGILYYREGERTLSDLSLSYATGENIFLLENVSGVILSDFTVTGLDTHCVLPTATAHFGQAGSLTQRYNAGGAVSYGFMTAAAVYGKNVEDVRIERVHVTETLGAGIYLAGIVEDVTIDSCSFIRLGEAAIRLGSGAYKKTSYVKNTDVTNNYVRSIGMLCRAAVGIQLNTAADCRIIGNTVMDVPYSGFSVGWIWSTVSATSDGILGGGAYCTYNTEIAYNYVTDFMTCMGDGGAFYLLGGNVTRASKDKTVYNTMHHNYVNASEESGKHPGGITGTGSRHIMCYYHDNSSSNWHDYENVLINTMETKDLFYGAFHQSIEKCEAQNNIQENNYFIGFDSLKAVYRNNSNMLRINTEFGITGADYVYASVRDLERNNPVPSVTIHGFQSLASPYGQRTAVARIFASAGSDMYRETLKSGLTYTTSADRVPMEDNGNVEVGDIIPSALPCDVGDVTMDGVLDELDVWALKQHLVKSRILSDKAIVFADVNGDDKVDARDVMRLMQRIAAN